MNRLTKTAAMVAVATVALTGCNSTKSIKPQERKPAKLVKLEQSVSVLSPVVSVSLPQATGRFKGAIDKKDSADLQVAFLGKQMIAASPSGVVSAYQGSQLLWSSHIGETITSGVASDEALGMVVVGTRSGKIVAIDGSTGEVRWQKSLPSASLAPALIMGNRVLVSANNGVLFALESATGEMVWQFGTQTPNISVRGTANLLRLDAQTVIFSTSDGRIHAINPVSGRPLWVRRIGRAVGGSQVHRMSDVDGMPLVVGHHLYVASYSGQLMAFDLSTGRMVFDGTLPSIKELTSHMSLVIGASVDGDLVAFDRLTGEIVWENSELQYRKLTNPVAINGYVFVGDVEGVIHTLDAKTGKIIARNQTKGQLNRLQVQFGRLYTQSSQGVLSVWQVAQ